MFSTSVRDGRGALERCEWKTASPYRFEIDAVRARGRVPRGHVALRPAVAKHDEAAGLVGLLRLGVLDERRAHLGGDHHQRRAAIDPSTAPRGCGPQPAEGYFQ